MVSSSYPQHAFDWKSIFIQQMLEAIASNDRMRISFWGPPGVVVPDVDYDALPEEKAWLDMLMKKGGLVHLLRQGRMSGVSESFRFLWMLRKVYRRHTDVGLFHVNWLLNALPLLGIKKSCVISVLGSDIHFLKKPLIVSCLRRILKQAPCILAPNAEWMVPVLKNSFGDLAQIKTVFLGINQEWFDLERKWDKHPKKWLVVLRLTRKKIGPLFEWGCDIFKDNNYHELHLFGPMQEDIEIPDWVVYHGATYPGDLLENWFPKAAGLVSCSQHDEGRPQVMLEAMAAGLPVIASSIPAHTDLIQHRLTGCLIDSREELADGITWLSNVDHNHYISERAREWVSQEIGTWNDCAQRYLALYDELVQIA